MRSSALMGLFLALVISGCPRSRGGRDGDADDADDDGAAADGSNGCLELSDCLGGCDDDEETCLNRCSVGVPAAGREAFDEILVCYQGACPAAPDEEIETCLQQSCPDELSGCT